MSAGDGRKTGSEDKALVRLTDDLASGFGAGLSRRPSLPYHSHVVVRSLADDASLDCRASVPCCAEALLAIEYAVRGVAGQDQLHPLLVATVVCLRHSSPAGILPALRRVFRKCFLLFDRATHVAHSRTTSNQAAVDAGIRGGVKAVHEE